MNHRKVGFFIIKIKKSNIIFKLELFKETRIYPIFYISLLESTDSKILIQNKPLKLLSENKYKIESIRDYDLEIY